MPRFSVIGEWCPYLTWHLEWSRRPSVAKSRAECVPNACVGPPRLVRSTPQMTVQHAWTRPKAALPECYDGTAPLGIDTPIQEPAD